MILSPLPIQKFFASDGRPLAGGKLFTYTAGTTTKVATYTDSTGGTPNTNPVILNFRGEANVWLDPTLTYKFVLSPANDTDPPTNPIWTEDQVAGGLTINEMTLQFLGQILYPRTTAEISVSVTPISCGYPPGDLRRYGCDTTGGTDNSTQIQNAIKAAQASGGTGYILHPGGNIAHSSQILFGPGLSIIGYDRSACVFTYTGTSSAWRHTNNGTASPTANSSGFGKVIFRGVKIITSSGSNTGAAIELNACGYSYYDVLDCWLSGTFKYGLILDGVEICHVERTIIENGGPANPINIWLVNGDDRTTGQLAGFTNVVTVNNNQISGAGGFGVADDGGNGHTITNNNFNAHSVPMRACAVQSLVFSGNSLETNLQTGNANFLLTSIAAVSGATKGPCSNGFIMGNTFAGNMLSGACLRFVGDWHTGFHNSGNIFFSLFGRGSAIDVTFLGNSYCGQNVDLGTGAMSHYNAPHQDVHGNILMPPQFGAAVSDAAYPYEFGDIRSPIKGYGGVDFDTQGGLEFNLHKFQQFSLEIKNNGGTIQHRIITSHLDPATAPSANLIQCISGASATYQNTPTVGAGTGFGGVGVGITATAIYFDTNTQTRASNWSTAVVEYYDGNNTRTRPAVGFDSININGTTRQRLAIFLTDDMTGAAVAVNTTLLPAGKTIGIKVFAGVAA